MKNMQKIVAVILAGGPGMRLSILTQERAKPAVPFGGKYRLIDFTLSNCVHSGIYDVIILTQYRPRSLYEHIGVGKHHDLDRLEGGVLILQPHLRNSFDYLGGGKETITSDWYSGTADAIYHNLSYIEAKKADLVLILSGDHVYKMDYRKMIAFHQEKKSDVTLAVTSVKEEETHRFGIIVTDENSKIIDFQEKPKIAKSRLASMGVYLFNYEVLEQSVLEDAKDNSSSHDFGKDIFPKLVAEKKHNLFAYQFSEYWRDVGTVTSYYESNMDLLAEPPLFQLDDPDWCIYTKSEEQPPVKLAGSAMVSHSLIANGSIIAGKVIHSILFPGVVVERDAEVIDSIIMSNSYIGQESKINKAILDKNIFIGAKCQIGYNYVENTYYENDGIVLIGKGVYIPTGTKIPPGSIISK